MATELETKPETTSAPQRTPREEALASLEPVEIVEQPTNEDEAVPAELAAEVNGTVDSQPAEESATQETDAEKVELSDEDIQQTFETEKTNVQKRIDKLTAEKYSLKEDRDALMKRIEQLEAKLNTPAEPKEDQPKQYTVEDLERAKTVAYRKIEDGDTAEGIRILDEANRELQKLEIERAKKDATKQLTQDDEFKQRENVVWQQYAQMNPSDDPDFNLNDPKSKLFQWTGKLYHENPERYNQYGEHRFVYAAMEARDMIVKTRLQKEANQKIKSLEKQLGKQRAATQMDGGIPNAGSAPSTSADDVDPIAERMGVFNQARKFA